VEFLNLGVELIEHEAKRAGQRVFGEQRRPVRTEDPKIELGIEEGDFEAVAGRGIAMGVRNAKGGVRRS
jgi:hypothetical protein